MPVTIGGIGKERVAVSRRVALIKKLRATRLEVARVSGTEGNRDVAAVAWICTRGTVSALLIRPL